MLKSVSQAFYDQKFFLEKNVFSLKTKGGPFGFGGKIRRVPPLVFDQKIFFQLFFEKKIFFLGDTSGIDPLVYPENFSPLAQTVWMGRNIV